MTPQLSRRVGSALAEHWISFDERKDVVGAIDSAHSWDDLPPDMQDLIVDIESRPRVTELLRRDDAELTHVLGELKTSPGQITARSYKRDEDGRFASTGGEGIDEGEFGFGVAPDGTSYTDHDVDSDGNPRFSAGYRQRYGSVLDEYEIGSTHAVVLASKGSIHVADDSAGSQSREVLAEFTTAQARAASDGVYAVYAGKEESFAGAGITVRPASANPAADGVQITWGGGKQSTFGGDSSDDAAFELQEGLSLAADAHDKQFASLSRLHLRMALSRSRAVRAARILNHPGHADQSAHLPGKHDQSSHGRKRSGQRTLHEAQQRQADIDAARRVGSAAADIDEWVNNADGVADKSIRDGLYSRINRHERSGALDTARADDWRSSVDAGDLNGLRAKAAEFASSQGLAPIGRAGDQVGFDREQHQTIAGDLSPGTPVEIVRQGHSLNRYSEQIRLQRAVVEPT